MSAIRKYRILHHVTNHRYKEKAKDNKEKNIGKQNQSISVDEHWHSDLSPLISAWERCIDKNCNKRLLEYCQRLKMLPKNVCNMVQKIFCHCMKVWWYFFYTTMANLFSKIRRRINKLKNGVELRIRILDLERLDIIKRELLDQYCCLLANNRILPHQNHLPEPSDHLILGIMIT